MVQLRLDQGAVLLQQAVTPLIEMVRFVDIRISPEDLTLVSVSNYPMFPQVCIALRMRSWMSAQFRCDQTRWICINLHHLFSALALALSEESIEIHGDESEDMVGFVFINPIYARITDTEVRLSAANEEVLLTTENCIIGGAVSEEDPVTLREHNCECVASDKQGVVALLQFFTSILHAEFPCWCTG